MSVVPAVRVCVCMYSFRSTIYFENWVHKLVHICSICNTNNRNDSFRPLMLIEWCRYWSRSNAVQNKCKKSNYRRSHSNVQHAQNHSTFYSSPPPSLSVSLSFSFPVYTEFVPIRETMENPSFTQCLLEDYETRHIVQLSRYVVDANERKIVRKLFKGHFMCARFQWNRAEAGRSVGRSVGRSIGFSRLCLRFAVRYFF